MLSACVQECVCVCVCRCISACAGEQSIMGQLWSHRSGWPWRLISDRGNTVEDRFQPSFLSPSFPPSLSPSHSHRFSPLSFSFSFPLPLISSLSNPPPLFSFLSFSCFIPGPNYSFYFSNYTCHLSSSLICHMMIIFCPSLYRSHISHDKSHGPIRCTIFLFKLNLQYVSIWSPL